MMPIRGGGPRVYRVAELNDELRLALAKHFGSVWVEGEVSDPRHHGSSGNLYFKLHDEERRASVSCVLGRAPATEAQLVEQGRRVRVLGHPTLYVVNGSFQLQVERVEDAGGLGELLRRREALTKQLQAEGLFDPQRKRPLPREPRTIGVVTSLSGAVLDDIVRVATRRGAPRILLAHAAVQGGDAVKAIILALKRVARVVEVDVVIVARGGGSKEDLAAFDDENVVRAIANAEKPVVAAIGHDRDWSLSCRVADARAATPSQAAELVVPERVHQGQRAKAAADRLLHAFRESLRQRELVETALSRRLLEQSPRFERLQMAVDTRLQRLVQTSQRKLLVADRRLAALQERLFRQDPHLVLRETVARFAESEVRLSQAFDRRLGTIDRRVQMLATKLEGQLAQALRDKRAELGTLAGRLDALSPLAVLSRGYAIALQEDGTAVRSEEQVRTGERLKLRLHEGAIDVLVVSKSIR